MRPEFDVTLAYNPDSVLLPVARIEGIGWTAARRRQQRRRLDHRRPGRRGAAGRQPRSDRRRACCSSNLGSDAAALSGNSRAAQWMLLDQLIDEARGRIAAGLARTRC